MGFQFQKYMTYGYTILVISKRKTKKLMPNPHALLWGLLITPHFFGTFIVPGIRKMHMLHIYMSHVRILWCRSY